jgi:hypothetical protein
MSVDFVFVSGAAFGVSGGRFELRLGSGLAEVPDNLEGVLGAVQRDAPEEPEDLPDDPRALRGTAEPDRLAGRDAADLLAGLAGDDTLLGEDGADTLEGGPGDDLLDPGPGDDILFGGEGTDTARIEARRDEVVVEPLGEGALAIAGPGGENDRLAGVERVSLEDGALVSGAPSEDAGFVFRLFEGLLDRAPDAGLLFWLDALEAGAPRESVAEAFLGSEEFALRRPGPVSDEAFVEGLFLDFLERPGDAAGRTFFVERLGEGLARADLAARFAESAEAEALSADALAGGIFLPDLGLDTLL